MNYKKPKYITLAENATIDDISIDSLKWFIDKAKNERNYKFTGKVEPINVLNQLSLVEQDNPLIAALMLFGKDPQRYSQNAVVKCSYYYGTEVSRPIPSHQVFSGNLFQQVDKSVDFVMSKLDRFVGGRNNSPIADTRYEIPHEVISEIIVNAVVHRDYDLKGSVQITIFSDRIIIANPGKLPEELSVEDLTKDHLSIPVNPFLARPFFLAGYINQLGYGTLNVVKWCLKANLPEPDFDESNNSFQVTIWRNWLTNKTLDGFRLNQRQRDAVMYLKSNPSITNSDYQELFKVAKRTSSKDLSLLVSYGLIKKIGTTGKGVYYKISKGAPKGHNGH